MNHGRFAAVINCIDGRTQLPVIEWLKRETGADYVDSITEPGPVRILAEAKDVYALESVRRRLGISVEKHKSIRVAVVAHADCAGNPVDKETQLNQLRSAASRVLSWGMGVRVQPLWVDTDWLVQRVG